MTKDIDFRAARLQGRASLDTLKLVEQLPRDLGDRLPLRLAEMKRPLWTRLTKKRVDPFRLRQQQILGWMNALAKAHPPLVIQVERATGETRCDPDVAAVA